MNDPIYWFPENDFRYGFQISVNDFCEREWGNIRFLHISYFARNTPISVFNDFCHKTWPKIFVLLLGKSFPYRHGRYHCGTIEAFGSLRMTGCII